MPRFMERPPGRTSTKLSPLEFSVFQRRPTLENGAVLGAGHKVLVAVSGGADSVGLLHILKRLSGRWGFELIAVHVHHGPGATLRQTRFRDRAEELVLKTAEKLGVEAVVSRPRGGSKKTGPQKTRPVASQSEEALREIRKKALIQQSGKFGASLIAMAHHADDLFETRLIRLLRGTGAGGFLAMQEMMGAEKGLKVQIWRPLLAHSRSEIETDLGLKKLRTTRDWLEDPSNLSDLYLRGRIRRELIPMFEKVRVGGLDSMARSFQLMAEALTEAPSQKTLEDSALDRAELMKLSTKDRCRRLSMWLSGQEVRNFSKSQIEEVVKRIDTPRKRLSFTVGRRVWIVDQNIRLKPGGSGP